MIKVHGFQKILITYIVIALVRSQDEECTGVEDTERVDCGVLGTEEEDCLELNCCWEEQPEGTPTPWCYYRPSAPCLSSPCVNGECLDDGSGGYVCDCYPGYIGDNCDDLDESICSAEDRETCVTEVELCFEFGCCYDPSINLCYFWAGGPRGPEGENCVVDSAERTECGIGDPLRMAECLDQGCCWDPVSDAGAPWCFDSMGSLITTEPPTLDPSCIVADELRTECGYSGIEPDECEFSGCCWAEATGQAPSCFYPNGTSPVPTSPPSVTSEQPTLEPSCIIADNDRDDCGFSGITPDQCESELGCCWAAPENIAPFCFYPLGSETTTYETETDNYDYEEFELTFI